MFAKTKNSLKRGTEASMMIGCARLFGESKAQTFTGEEGNVNVEN
jgi:hypothetical protein